MWYETAKTIIRISVSVAFIKQQRRGNRTGPHIAKKYAALGCCLALNPKTEIALLTVNVASIAVATTPP